MFPQFKATRRRGLLSAVLNLLSASTLLLVGRASASPSPATAPLEEATANTTLQDLSHLYLAPEASCAGHEGQWNCLSDRFQHCADGRWSALLSCSGASGDQPAASLCSPLGRTDLVDFEGECSAAWGWGGGGNNGGWGGGGGSTSCSGNRCYYGAGERLDVERWVYVAVAGAIVLGVW
ncbi:hypothetical protein CTA1_5844 [Colletotrichum tanaceti]|uniref:Extracellular membrane protein CFEM domain-containing protein n=1 Tax=Colletotrichum tanaceti TaxID=1306861 RepID=A0A4U6X1Z1_9PEZI|nr:hypothetical protein CTA1_5844 [Colletotrichum tanaceti]